MKIRTTLNACILAGMFALSNVATAIGFTDTFDGSVDPGWVTDRYEPAGFNSVGNVLEIVIDDADSAANRPPAYSSGFYNTQGRQHEALINGPWEVFGQIEVDLTGNILRRGDLWARTGNVGNEIDAGYPIIGYFQFDPADPFNPSASGITAGWRVWDGDTANGWVNLATYIGSGWYDLSMVYDGSQIDYSIDGTLVYSDMTPGALGGQLTTVFAQAYNFGGDYVQRFDNIGAREKTTSVPEAGATSLMLATGFIGLVLVARKTRRVNA